MAAFPNRANTAGVFAKMKRVSIDFGNVANSATDTVDITVTVAGLKANRPLLFFAPDLEAHLSFCNAHASAKDTLKVRFRNLTAGAINPAAQTCYVVQL